jgi:MYXO-CTERM domain-containing protein
MFRRTLGVVSVVAALVSIDASAASAEFRSERAKSSTHPDWPVAEISPALRMQRAAQIRDTAALAGMFNAVLLAGIGQVETGFAHCWSEATWACQGPASASCAGGPVIAGGSDGPCADQQGGLGLFQFDSGTFTDTINTYGADIVTIEGNVSAVVPFLVTRAVQSIEGVNNEEEALAWMNSIPVVAGDPLFEEWIYFVSWRYNGCKGCSAQEAKYRDGTLLLLDEMGAGFWETSTEDLCAPITLAGATIEEDDDCYRASGPAAYWRDENAGHGGTLQWTKTTSNDTPSNYGTWRLRFADAGAFEVEVFTDGGGFGMSQAAAYELTHADGVDTVVIDQSLAEGWVSLGTFAFDGAEGYQVRLTDNTGEAWAEEPGGTKIMFDALRVTAQGGGNVQDLTNPAVDDTPEGASAGCSVSGSGSGIDSGAKAMWPLLGLLFVFRRRKARGSIAADGRQRNS